VTDHDRFSQHALARDVFAVVPTHEGRVCLTVSDPTTGREAAAITMPGSSAAWLAQELLDAAKLGTT
jgi:hypothetical protein